MYKQFSVKRDGQWVFDDGCVQRIADNAFIPFDESNTDYQEYLKWVSEGNQPLPSEQA